VPALIGSARLHCAAAKMLVSQFLNILFAPYVRVKKVSVFSVLCVCLLLSSGKIKS